MQAKNPNEWLMVVYFNSDNNIQQYVMSLGWCASTSPVSFTFTCPELALSLSLSLSMYIHVHTYTCTGRRRWLVWLSQSVLRVFFLGTRPLVQFSHHLWQVRERATGTMAASKRGEKGNSFCSPAAGCSYIYFYAQECGHDHGAADTQTDR